MQMFSGLRRFSALIVPEGKEISADIPYLGSFPQLHLVQRISIKKASNLDARN